MSEVQRINKYLLKIIDALFCSSDRRLKLVLPFIRPAQCFDEIGRSADIITQQDAVFCTDLQLAAIMSSPKILKTVVFMGSSRSVTPPWGGDVRLGDRVLKWVESTLQSRKEKLGDEIITHDFSVVDPKDVFAEGGALAEISRGDLTVPTFFLKELPPKAQALKDLINAADCYVVVSPEYNHTVPPALASLMGHFGGSNFSAKPSGIVTYSPGPWGGMRAAMTICNMCHELGCLPVSKLCGLPTVASILNEDGSPIDPSHRMLAQLPGMLTQLEWMAVAMKTQREKTGVF
jgi:NAD(P)H-dependent FMN reductase|uniref:NADPH-dependent FMN reductase-like domain-containing protein n=1 Tax=Phaeodactylum tricornutum TaxID=2850 RepID=A0A8J9SDT2_PHATR